MVKLNEFKSDYVVEGISGDDLNFLNLSGRQAYHSQGILGEDIICAVVDTGVNEHPELEDRILEGRNFCGYRRSDDTRDDNSHGTHVAGSVAGKNVGIAPKAKILPVKVLAGDGDGRMNDLVDALYWINDYRYDGKKVNVVSMSLSTNGRAESDDEMKRFHEAIQALVSNDIAVVVSAGNTGKEEDRYPACYDEVICVGAVDYLKDKAYFSTMGHHVDLTQVGVDVLSCNYEGGYVKFSGTSMSTPITSGIACLIACKYNSTFDRRISETFLYETMKFNTKDLGVLGLDKEFGAGFLTLQPLNMHMWMQHENTNLMVNGKRYELDVPANIVEGRFTLPARAFSEAFGTYISFDQETRSATFIS